MNALRGLIDVLKTATIQSEATPVHATSVIDSTLTDTTAMVGVITAWPFYYLFVISIPCYMYMYILFHPRH